MQGHTFVSMEVPRITEPLRIASALTLATPDDVFSRFDATDDFKQTMAQRLNGAVAPPGVCWVRVARTVSRRRTRMAATSPVI